MIEAFWIPLLPPYLMGLALSFAAEALLTPRPVAPWRRPLAAVGVHVGVWTLAFALELMLFRRPYFAVANVLAIELLIVLVSNAKYQALREPFVYPDFEYFTDAIKHPRLYLPFLGIGSVMAASGGYGAALWAGLALEDSVTLGAGMWVVSFAQLPQEGMFDPAAPVAPFFLHSVALGIIGLTIVWVVGHRVSVSFDALADLRGLGLLASLWRYCAAERTGMDAIRETATFERFSTSSVGGNTVSPDLISIQSESFFDIRKTFPLVQEDVLHNFDLLCKEAIQHGSLRVPAWGANTVRSEFAFLSGIAPETMGVFRYNPYRRLGSKPFPTIASFLRGQGYRTVCVHPYYGSFYGRNRVLRQLGFEEFIDIKAFSGVQPDGPYIGDRALAQHVLELLKSRADSPLYIHVITMENHGPLHWETVTQEDATANLRGTLPKGCEDLVAYVRHLRNADAMFGMLRDGLRQHGRPASLCVFGDHVPIMAKVYGELGCPSGTTDYLVWANHKQGGGQRKDMSVEALANDYLRTSIYGKPLSSTILSG